MAAKKKSAKQNSKAAASSEGRFSYDGLDRVMHEKARLGILASWLPTPKVSSLMT
ncbi:MAG: hypothetical protein R3C11_29815 [Planctomycetaceae bacterium]